MAQHDSRSARTPPATPPDEEPVAVRVLRAESQYRRETRDLPREERDRYNNFLWNMVRLDPGPRVTLNDLVGPNQDAHLDDRAEGAMQASVDYYRNKPDHTDLIRVLKFFAAYLLQRARQEPRFSRQQFLLFKAADFCRMIVQYSPYAASADAEAMVFGIFVDMGGAKPEHFGHYMHSEQDIYHLMRRVQMLPNDLRLRYQLAQRLAAQTSHIDALVQYQMLLRLYPPRGHAGERIHGLVYARIGELFQDLAEHAAPGLRDARKLKNFIDRFNRDFASRDNALPRITGPDDRHMPRARAALAREATRWTARAVEVPALDRRQRAVLAMRAARNQLADQPREAVRTLEQGYFLWSGLRETHDVLTGKAEYLRLLSSAAVNAKDKDRMGWAARELSNVQERLGQIDRERREHDQRRAALLG